MRPHLQVITAIAAIASLVVLATGLVHSPQVDSGRRDARTYETTGSASSTARWTRTLRLSDEQRERIYRGLIDFPDHRQGDARKPELADKLSTDQAIQDLPQGLTQEIPVLHAHRFVKLDDRILLVDPSSRVVVAMIPRYRVLQ
jgi:hypothetical protein